MTARAETVTKHKILLLDDDPDVLDTYQQMLLQSPSKPEVHIATSGARAIAMLDSEPFDLLVSDLKMPRMDGLQVITMVRRKHPQLRTIVLTGVADEEMRARAYAMGIDLYLEKPADSKDVRFLLDCIESLLDREKSGAGFRGIQSKSLVDLIQLECLSGSSSMLKITNGKLEGRIWIQNGELIDAATDNIEGEDAFRRILAWKMGNFEILPMETERRRRITISYQGLLLDSVQAQDEANADPSPGDPIPIEGEAKLSDTQFFRKAGLGRIQGVEYALKVPDDKSVAVLKWGVENADPLAAWIRATVSEFAALGDTFKFGPVKKIECRGLQRNLSVVSVESGSIAVGMLPSVSREQAEQSVTKVIERWAS